MRLDYADIWQWSREIVTFAAHSVSLILGLIALWALIFKGKKLAFVVRVFMSVFLNERLRRIRETLNKIESLNYEEKKNRPEIRALLGQVSGQIKPMIAGNNRLSAIHMVICNLVEDKTALTEPQKRSVVAELNGHLDDIAFTHTSNFFE